MAKYNLTLSRGSAHSIILSQISDTDVVLDVGCCEGYIGRESGKCKKRFYGIDSDLNSISVTKKIYKKALLINLDKNSLLPFKKKFSDIILFADILEHLKYPTAILIKFKKFLKPHGKIIVSLPNIANFLIRIRLMFGTFDYTKSGILDETHLHFYTIKTAKKLIEDAGYKIVEMKFASNNLSSLFAFPQLRGLFAHNIIMVCKKNGVE